MAVCTSLLQDVATPTDQVTLLVVPHTQCPCPAVTPLLRPRPGSQVRDHATTAEGGGEVGGAGRVEGGSRSHGDEDEQCCSCCR